MSPAPVINRAPHRARFAWALVLLALAGAVDATGFLYLRGLFVSFMSGNTTQTAVLAAGGDWSGAGTIAAVIIAFIVGVVTGDLIAGEPPRGGGFVLLSEAALLVVAWRLPVAAGPLLAFAMGMHNALVLCAERVGLALTYVTGTLVHLGRAVAARLAGRDRPPPGWPYLAMWMALLLGGIVGGALHWNPGAGALLALATALALCGVGEIIWRRRT